jgi:hypothetical protein
MGVIGTTWGRTGVVAAFLLFTSGLPARADEVLRWNRLATDVSAAAQTDPLTESRAFAILHCAVHDALNAIEPRYETMTAPVPAPRGADPAAAVAGAAHDTLVALFPAARARFDAALKESLDAIADGAARSEGVAVGRQAAARVLAMRGNDGASLKVPYEPGRAAGAYRPTPPDFTPAFMTHWGQVAPFTLRSAAQFRPAPPPAVSSAEARADVAEVERFGGARSTARTEEQSEIARFWYEASTQGWNRVARTVAEAQQPGPWENARLLALLNMAMADGFVAGFDAKYHYNYWRPVTAIREGGDAAWLAYLPTPPVPDHPSTHTVLGAAAATVLARFFGTDFVSFSFESGPPHPGLTRRFWSFSQAARENGASRVFAGIHFRTAVRAGYEQGEAVGAWVYEHALRPVAAAEARVSGARSERSRQAGSVGREPWRSPLTLSAMASPRLRGLAGYPATDVAGSAAIRAAADRVATRPDAQQTAPAMRYNERTPKRSAMGPASARPTGAEAAERLPRSVKTRP